MMRDDIYERRYQPRMHGKWAHLVRDSFDGIINKPAYDSNFLATGNISKVTDAIAQVLTHLNSKVEA